MTILDTETFEACTIGGSVTTANTLFGNINSTWTGVAGLVGSVAASLSGTGYGHLRDSGLVSPNVLVFRCVLKLGSLPSSAVQIMDVWNGDITTGLRLGSVRVESNGTLTIRDREVAVATSTYGFSPNFVYALEWKVVLSTGTQFLRIFNTSSLFAAPVETLQAALTPSAQMTQFQVGRLTSGNINPLIIDDYIRANAWIATPVTTILGVASFSALSSMTSNGRRKARGTCRVTADASLIARGSGGPATSVAAFSSAFAHSFAYSTVVGKFNAVARFVGQSSRTAVGRVYPFGGSVGAFSSAFSNAYQRLSASPLLWQFSEVNNGNDATKLQAFVLVNGVEVPINMNATTIYQGAPPGFYQGNAIFDGRSSLSARGTSWKPNSGVRASAAFSARASLTASGTVTKPNNPTPLDIAGDPGVGELYVGWGNTGTFANWTNEVTRMQAIIDPRKSTADSSRAPSVVRLYHTAGDTPFTSDTGEACSYIKQGCVVFITFDVTVTGTYSASAINSGSRDSWLSGLADDLNKIRDKWDGIVWLAMGNEPSTGTWKANPSDLAALRACSRYVRSYLKTAGCTNFEMMTPTYKNDDFYTSNTKGTQRRGVGSYDGWWEYHPDWKGTGGTNNEGRSSHWDAAACIADPTKVWDPDPADFYQGTSRIIRIVSANSYCWHAMGGTRAYDPASGVWTWSTNPDGPWDDNKIYQQHTLLTHGNATSTADKHFLRTHQTLQKLYSGVDYRVAIGEFGYPIYEQQGVGNTFPWITADFFEMNYEDLITARAVAVVVTTQVGNSTLADIKTDGNAIGGRLSSTDPGATDQPADLISGKDCRRKGIVRMMDDARTKGPRTVPTVVSGKMLIGENKSLGWSTMYNKFEGPYWTADKNVFRAFQDPGPWPSSFDSVSVFSDSHLGNCPMIISLKPPLDACANGTDKAAALQFLRSIPSNRRIWFTIYHEPEDKPGTTFSKALGNICDYIDTVRAEGNKNLYSCVIVMNQTLSDGKGSTWYNDKVMYVGADCYRDTNMESGLHAFMKLKKKPGIIGELSCEGGLNNANSSNDREWALYLKKMIERARSWSDYKIAAICHFNGSGAGTVNTITDGDTPISLRQMQHYNRYGTFDPTIT